MYYFMVYLLDLQATKNEGTPLALLAIDSAPELNPMMVPGRM